MMIRPEAYEADDGPRVGILCGANSNTAAVVCQREYEGRIAVHCAAVCAVCDEGATLTSSLHDHIAAHIGTT